MPVTLVGIASGSTNPTHAKSATALGASITLYVGRVELSDTRHLRPAATPFTMVGIASDSTHPTHKAGELKIPFSRSSTGLLRYPTRSAWFPLRSIGRPSEPSGWG